MGRGQAWSMDLVIGVLIFLLAIGIIYSLLSARQAEDVRPLRLQSEAVATKLTSDPVVQITQGNNLEMNSLVGLAVRAQTDYEGVRKELGIEHDFCIYLVDEDGMLTYITNGTHNFTGIGPANGDVKVSGVDCGQSFNIDNP